MSLDFLEANAKDAGPDDLGMILGKQNPNEKNQKVRERNELSCQTERKKPLKKHCVLCTASVMELETSEMHSVGA